MPGVLEPQAPAGALSQGPALEPSPSPVSTSLTNAGDAILGQHRSMVTEADDLVSLGVHVTLVYLTVTAV